mmetsp:Transcript_70304/g.152766  ORF Transcript_70304/g.152766 Transcript_70304/m.152766 type:complete len:126 (+) Transcript_70304:66-443(+)
MAGEQITAGKGKKTVKKGTRQPVRLYCKGIVLGYKRSKTNTYATTTLIKIDGVRTREDTSFYVGKRCAFVYKCKREVRNSRYRVMWGKVKRPHGNSGVVRAKFRKNLPPRCFGGPVRIMMYPSKI